MYETSQPNLNAKKMKSKLNYIHAFATFSEDKKHRFVLHRLWDKEKPCAMVIGLNPSNANESDDDPTIGFVTRVLNFNGYGGLFMVNLYTMITPHPEELIMDENIEHTIELWSASMNYCKDVIFAWGNFRTFGRNETAKRIYKNALCFNRLKNGEPRHAMYLKETTVLKKYLCD